MIFIYCKARYREDEATEDSRRASYFAWVRYGRPICLHCLLVLERFWWRGSLTREMGMETNGRETDIYLSQLGRTLGDFSLLLGLVGIRRYPV